MAVKSTTFGGVRLSGSEARKFQQQVKFGRPKKAASESAKRGSVLRTKLIEDGSVLVSPRRKA